MKTAKPELAGKPRLSRAEQKLQRSQDLLQAARIKFMEKGYEAVTIDDVAEYAGMSRMPVYSLFGDKQNLFFELWHSTVGQLSKRLVGVSAPGQPLRSKLTALADLIGQGDAAASADDPGMNLFFVVQTIALSRPEIAAKLRATAQEIVADFTAFIRDATHVKGERLRSDPETVAVHIVAHINGLSTAQFQTGKRYLDPRELAEIFIGIAIRTA
ncbi:TetR/AcrR family transcriptional regulator [Solimonas sp. SE-A11]|uniref:TetR/AcrR family transcriptional regulator n=1 Tax=Solimonas sp. SE-A11 TaxID=3054954 RepID=UPI00259CDC13|nr:TetR/AcrR family transcriptional regulator [Solimonas sp. SE-A11]MDM4769822.1 TetR/AcrR family transcriptional regulator [Solimonas sp. SE-A11]